MALLVDDERDQQRSRSGELGNCAGRAPTNVRRLHERVDEQQHPGRDEDPAEQVEVPQRRLAPLAADQLEGRYKQEQADGEVDPQDPAPAGTFR